jgi:hypothetical protein
VPTWYTSKTANNQWFDMHGKVINKLSTSYQQVINNPVSGVFNNRNRHK